MLAKLSNEAPALNMKTLKPPRSRYANKTKNVETFNSKLHLFWFGKARALNFSIGRKQKRKKKKK